MPAYPQLPHFMARVHAVNNHFERFKRSSLRPLINNLSSPTGNAVQVHAALATIPAFKTRHYKDALYYLTHNYPGVNPNNLNLGPLDKTNAARFTMTAATAAYNPAHPVSDKVVAPSAFLAQTVEQFLIVNPGSGIVLIHLTDHNNNLDDEFNGTRVVDHMNSVLRVGNLTNADVCILHQQAPPVCAALQAEVNAYPPARVTACHVHPQHMGNHNAAFQIFVTGHTNVVVMGFDATICVRANMFGADEHLPGGGFVPPMITQTNLVTSRAVLVVNGNITPVNHRGEYGVLFNT